MHRFSLRPAAISTLLLTLLGLAGCNKDSSDTLGQAYVAPEALNLRRELGQKNSAVAVLRHGDRVSIIDVRRRFVKIRSRKGEEGWVDAIQLLSPEQMDQFKRDAQRAATMPSQGSATVFEALNIHLEPNRKSPAFTRISEGGSVVVLAHRAAPKNSDAPKSPNFLSDRPQPPSRRQRKEKQARSNSRLPPRPPAPKPPENWQELSTERIDGAESTADVKARKEQEATEKKAAELKRPIIMEDWSLVRTKNNQSGWVLSRNLVMSIPDEVAQYAEGKRITSYFDLGSVPDEEKGVKHNWLWTTASTVGPNDFDAWRVFLWNRRRHRYETSYRQRDVEGYFPVRVDPSDPNAFGRTFKLVTKDDDGKFRRRAYVFDGTRVHLTATEDYHPGVTGSDNHPGALDTGKIQAKIPREGWFRKKWDALKRSVLRE
jgi:uncharacterized protein YgiM (DUF1202 family)